MGAALSLVVSRGGFTGGPTGAMAPPKKFQVFDFSVKKISIKYKIGKIITVSLHFSMKSLAKREILMT